MALGVRIVAGAGAVPPQLSSGVSSIQDWEAKKATQDARRMAQIQRSNQAQQSKMFTAATMLAAPLTNPTSLWGNLLTGVALQRALQTPKGQNILGKVGMAGAAGTTVATGGIMALAIGLGAALKMLTKAISETFKAIEDSNKLYRYKVLSGLSAGTAASRQNAAQVIGVSTEDVLKFGGAMNQLAPKLRNANETMAKTYRTLTYTSWQFKVLEVNMSALFSNIAYKASPALNGIAKGLNLFVGALDKVLQSKVFRALLAGAFPGTTLIGANLAKFGGKEEAAIGPVGQVPKRASSWEKMGLVIGGPTGAGRLEQIAKAQLHMLGKIHHALGGRDKAGAQPLNNITQFNLPRA